MVMTALFQSCPVIFIFAMLQIIIFIVLGDPKVTPIGQITANGSIFQFTAYLKVNYVLTDWSWSDVTFSFNRSMVMMHSAHITEWSEVKWGRAVAQWNNFNTLIWPTYQTWNCLWIAQANFEDTQLYVSSINSVYVPVPAICVCSVSGSDSQLVRSDHKFSYLHGQTLKACRIN